MTTGEFAMVKVANSARELDVAVVGAGFSGIYVVYSFKKRVST